MLDGIDLKGRTNVVALQDLGVGDEEVREAGDQVRPAVVHFGPIFHRRSLISPTF